MCWSSRRLLGRKKKAAIGVRSAVLLTADRLGLDFGCLLAALERAREPASTASRTF